MSEQAPDASGSDPGPGAEGDGAVPAGTGTRGLHFAIGRLDATAERTFERMRGNALANRVFYTASALGDWSLVWHVAGVAQALADPVHGARRAVRLSVALGAESALVNGLVKSLFRRTRPPHQGERPHNLRTPVTSSFPSGHASSAFMAASLLSERSSLGPLWFALAAVVAASRVHVRIHHASDVAGGAVLGLVLAELVRRVAPLPTEIVK